MSVTASAGHIKNQEEEEGNLNTTDRFCSAGKIGLACLTLGLGACASSGETVAAAQCPEPAISESEYRIGAGDLLNIVVWRNTELSAAIPVRPDGRISTPLIDDMQASGKTPSQLADDMEGVLAEYLRTPEVSVIVTGQGTANQIQAIGEILNPQSISYRYGLKLLDVIVGVGGLTEFAAGNRADLVRVVDGEQVKCRVRLEDLLNGDISQNINIYPGDMLVVPETRF
jgi:polysaccharide export outer membrane protein